MATIHITEAEAARDLPAILAQVRAGAEIIIKSGDEVPAILHALTPTRRTLSESIALAESHEKKSGYVPLMDSEFAADMEEIIRNRRPRTSAWD